MNTMVVKIIWGALTLSQLTYGMILFILPGSEGQTGTPLPLWIPAIVTGLASVFIFMTRLSHLSLQTLFARTESKLAVSRTFVFYVICWALNESVALFGFVNAFLTTHQFTDFVPFLAAGVLLNFIMFPKVDQHLREAEARRLASGEQG